MSAIGWRAMVLMSGAIVAGSSMAAEVEYEVRGGLQYSNNVLRTATDEIDTSAGVVGLRLQGGRKTGRLQFGVAGDVAYNDYFESGVDSEVVGNMFADASYQFVPDAFRWDFDGSFVQIRETLLRPTAPGNRDDVLTLSTGPTLQLRFGDGFEAQIEGRFTRADYSERAFDSDTLGARLIVGRSLSERSLIGVGASFDNVTYDSQQGLGSIDFDRREAFVRLQTSGARTTLSLDAGIAEAQGDQVDDRGLLARLEATRRLTPFITGFVSYVQEYPTSEASALTPADAVDGGEIGDGSILTAAPRVAKRAEAGLRLERPRTSAQFSYTYTRETGLLLATGDRAVDGLRLNFTRALTPRSRAGVFAAYTKEDVGASSLSVDEKSYGAELSLTFGRNLGLDIRLEQRDRSGDVAADGYSELTGGIFLRYGRITGSAGGGSVTPTAYLYR